MGKIVDFFFCFSELFLNSLKNSETQMLELQYEEKACKCFDMLGLMT